jgi:hypothetical protein
MRISSRLIDRTSHRKRYGARALTISYIDFVAHMVGLESIKSSSSCSVIKIQLRLYL